MSSIAGMKTVYFTHKVIRDLFAGEPNERYIEGVGLLLNHTIECSEPIGCDRRAGPSSKAEGFWLSQEYLQSQQKRSFYPEAL